MACRAIEGLVSHTIAWLLLTFLGALGANRFYAGKWGSGPLYTFIVGLFGVSTLYDFWTLNTPIDVVNDKLRCRGT